MNFRPIFFALFASLALLSCAKVGSLSGGPEDKTPPKLDSLNSSRNYATRFSERKIELVFDEWLTLSDVASQVVISPPLAKKPEISLKGKAVRVLFDETEVLRPNTTYTINFGNSVKDFTAGNPAKDLRFVFSTGDFIDSLKTSGSVADAFSGEVVENIAVLLYDVLEDSVVRRERPYYFSKTDKSGQFVSQNLRPGTFKMVALDDVNQNMKFDEGERIAFPENFLNLPDTSKTAISTRLRLSKEFPVFRSVETSANRYGVAKIAYNSLVIKTLRPETETPGVKFLPEILGDSLLVWYDFPEGSLINPWNFWVGKDTLKVKALSRDDFLKSKKLRFAGEAVANSPSSRGGRVQKPQNASNAAAKVVVQNPAKPGVLDFNLPVVAADTSKWTLLEDSSKTRVTLFSARVDSLFPRRLNLITAWKSGKNYELVLPPGAVSDFYGGLNDDTLRRKFNVIPEKSLGGLNLILKNLKPETKYVLQLMNGSTVEEETVFEASSAEQKFNFPALPTAAFTVQVIEDKNGNGRWDPVDYFKKQQPELVFAQKLDALRANWETEATLDLGGSTQKRSKK